MMWAYMQSCCGSNATQNAIQYRYYTDNIAELSGEQECPVIVESEESVLVDVSEESDINVTMEDESNIKVIIEDIAEGVDLGCC